MIFVNNPGDWGHLLKPFDRAEWHGWTPTDLIFPFFFFFFIVGTAGVFSLTKRMERGASRRKGGEAGPDLPGAVTRLLLWGAAGVAAGGIWSLALPINKNLWTGSYVVFTSGFACVGLALSVVAVATVLFWYVVLLFFEKKGWY